MTEKKAPPAFPMLLTPNEPKAQQLMGPLMAAAEALGYAIHELPDSREKSLAWTYLHQCVMWAHQGALQETARSPLLVARPA